MTHFPIHGGLRRAVMGVALAAAISGCSLTVGPHGQTVAQESSTTVAIGESNNAQERAELLALFGVDDSSAVVDVTVAETLASWDGIFDLTGVDSAYSSTALTCSTRGSGVDVSTRNIEIIPPDLYALTLVTAGLTDVQLIVAAPDDAPALGMTALTGVFKTWDRSPCAGTGGDLERRDLALQELALVAEIGEAHGGADAVQSMTTLVLTLQQAVVLDQIDVTDTDAVDELITAQMDDLSLALTEDEQTQVSDFLVQLGNAQGDWDGYATGWSVDQAGDTSVAMRPGEAADDAVATGVGGPIGTIQPARATATSPPTETPQATATTVATATVNPSPIATLTPVALVTITPVSGVAGPIDGNGPTAGDEAGSGFPWWTLIALVPVALVILLVIRHRRRAPLVARQGGSVSGVATLAHRRAMESAAIGAVIQGEPVLQRASRRPISWRTRPRSGHA